MANAIVAPQPIAVEEGAKVLMAGGNAFDAAVTAAFVQCIVDPHSCGIGGYTLANIHLAGRLWLDRHGCTRLGWQQNHPRNVGR